MAYNSPKIRATLFTPPVRTTIDLLSTKHHHGSPGGADPLYTTRLFVFACGKSLLYVPQLRQW